MKNISIITILIATTFYSWSQTASDIFKATDYEYVYYGIDYSNAKFIGDFSQFADAGETSLSSIKDKYFEGWNSVIENEKEKYQLAEALRKEQIRYDLDFAAKVNAETDIEEMEASASNEMTLEDVKGIVNGYSLPDESGVGIIFITEYLNKNKENAGIHFVVFNISTKEVLLHNRYVKAAGGFGLRNYWIKPFYYVTEAVAKDFKKWKKEYAK